MNTVNQIAFQGDIAIVRVDALPSNAVEQPSTVSVVVAHSETGHHHAIDNTAGNVWLYSTQDQLVSYLKVKGHADIVHHRGWDTHAPIRLPEGVYQIRRQREWSPEGWRIVAD